MVRIGTVWDRTLDVIRGRAGMLAGIAALLLFLPGVADAAFDLTTDPGATLKAISSIVGLIAIVLSFWGMLALIAVASDPATDQARALRIGLARLGPALGVGLLVGLGFVLLTLPAFILIGGSGVDWELARTDPNAATANASTAMLGFASLYLLLLVPVMLWLAVRLTLLFPVVVNERQGAGAIRRSFALTRGLFWRLLGVLILYAVVFVVVLSAATFVTGTIFGIPFGRPVALFLAGVAGAVVTAAAGVLQAVFETQLYLAVREAAPDK